MRSCARAGARIGSACTNPIWCNAVCRSVGWKKFRATVNRRRSSSVIVSATRSVSRRGLRFTADVLLKPFEVGIHRSQQHLRLVWSMRLPRQHEHSRRHASRFECVVKLITLRDWHANVRLAVLKHRRRGHAFHLEHRRVFLIDVEYLPELAAEVVGNKRWNAGRPFKLIRFVTAAPAEAALKRFVCVTIHDVM